MNADTAAAIVEHALAISDGKTVTLTREAASALASGYRHDHDRAIEFERVLLAIMKCTTDPTDRRVEQSLPWKVADLIHPVAVLCQEAWGARARKGAP